MKEYKRVSKDSVIYIGIFNIVLIVVLGIFSDLLLFGVLILGVFLTQLLFDYLLDRSFNRKFAVSFLVIFAIIIAFLTYIFLQSVFDEIILSILLSIIVAFLTLSGLRTLRIPPFVINGFVDVELQKQYSKKVFKRIMIVLGIFLLIDIALYFLLY